VLFLACRFALSTGKIANFDNLLTCQVVPQGFQKKFGRMSVLELVSIHIYVSIYSSDKRGSLRV